MFCLDRSSRRRLPAAILPLLVALAGSALASDPHRTTPFSGVKVMGGTVMHSVADGRHSLTLSDDFKVPDAPAPHWQILDSQGNAHLLQRLVIKGDKLNKTIVVPSYVVDIARVQIWCAWAEVLLGEAAFAAPFRVAEPSMTPLVVSRRFHGVKANSGTVTATKVGDRLMLTLSDDFKVPDAPAPHWQVVDCQGRTHLLQRLVIKDDKLNRSILVPATVTVVEKVQIWCSYAETLLGEAAFPDALVN